MKQVFILTLTFAFIVGMSSSVLATGLMEKPIDKLSNGVVEVLHSPVTLIEHPMGRMDGDDMKPVGLLKGLLEAPFKFVKKAGNGVVDIATFPVE